VASFAASYLTPAGMPPRGFDRMEVFGAGWAARISPNPRPIEVWGERAGPVRVFAPKRFYPPPLPLAELPPVDVVLLSHDHYDHFHEGTIRALAARGEREARFVAPLGVGARLARWGVPEARIAECDWWESVTLDELTLTATPARHFSGRRVVRFICFVQIYQAIGSVTMISRTPP